MDWYASPLNQHLDDVDRVVAAGASVPASWAALRDRHAEPITDSMSMRYVNSVLTGQGDRVVLRAAAIAEARADTQAEAAVRNVLAAAVARELVAIYQPVANEVFALMAKQFDAGIGRMAKCCNTVDVLQDPAELLQATTAQRTSWAEAGALAAQCDEALADLAAGARLAGIAELNTFDKQLALVARAEDHRGVAIRKLFDDWAFESRAGRWPRCLWAKANALDTIATIEPPPPMENRMVRSGIGWKSETFDPLTEVVAAR